MFGRRKREEEQEESAREAERRALFEELAKRPDTVCPFLGLAAERAGYRPEPNAEHRCYAFGDPAPLSDEQQRHVCLERGYSNCPRYLRGVLVIPTEELEALRRPQAAAPPPPPPPVRAAQGGGGRRWIVVPLLLVLLAAAAGGGFYLLNNRGPVVFAPSVTPTPSESIEASPSPSAVPSQQASSAASTIATPTLLPTPTAGDKFLRYEVSVAPGTYSLFKVDDAGTIVGSQNNTFSRYSFATVTPITASNGLRHWRTANGGLAGYSYIAGRSGPFRVRKVFMASDGSLHAEYVPNSDL